MSRQFAFRAVRVHHGSHGSFATVQPWPGSSPPSRAKVTTPALPGGGRPFLQPDEPRAPAQVAAPQTAQALAAHALPHLYAFPTHFPAALAAGQRRPLPRRTRRAPATARTSRHLPQVRASRAPPPTCRRSALPAHLRPTCHACAAAHFLLLSRRPNLTPEPAFFPPCPSPLLTHATPAAAAAPDRRQRSAGPALPGFSAPSVQRSQSSPFSGFSGSQGSRPVGGRFRPIMGTIRPPCRARPPLSTGRCRVIHRF